MAHTKVNQQNLQFIGHQNFDHQHFEKKEASIDHQPAEWMKSYKDQAADIKKEIIALHGEYEESQRNFEGAKREIRMKVLLKKEEEAKGQSDKVVIAGLNDEIQDARMRMQKYMQQGAIIRRKREQKNHEMDEYWKRYGHWNLIKNGWSYCDHTKHGRFYYVTQEVLQCVMNASDDETAESISKKVWEIREKLNVKLVQGLTDPIFV